MINFASGISFCGFKRSPTTKSKLSSQLLRALLRARLTKGFCTSKPIIFKPEIRVCRHRETAPTPQPRSSTTSPAFAGTAAARRLGLLLCDSRHCFCKRRTLPSRRLSSVSFIILFRVKIVSLIGISTTAILSV